MPDLHEHQLVGAATHPPKGRANESASSEAYLCSGGGGGGALALRSAHQQLCGLLSGAGAMLQLRLRLLHRLHLAPQRLHLRHGSCVALVCLKSSHDIANKPEAPVLYNSTASCTRQALCTCDGGAREASYSVRISASGLLLLVTCHYGLFQQERTTCWMSEGTLAMAACTSAGGPVGMCPVWCCCPAASAACSLQAKVR